ncbi:hypothetical protein ACP25C_15880 [Cronobacter turicensis]
MSEISKEALTTACAEKVKQLEFSVKQSAFDSVRQELETELAIARVALMALRERAEPVTVPDLHKVIYHFRDLNEDFPVKRFKADYVIAWMLENYTPAPPAPVVPDECSFDGLDKDSKDYEVARMVGQVEGWNAFRAAMLQPVSAPYQLPGKEG